jgi:hypothetical protein
MPDNTATSTLIALAAHKGRQLAQHPLQAAAHSTQVQEAGLLLMRASREMQRLAIALHQVTADARRMSGYNDQVKTKLEVLALSLSALKEAAQPAARAGWPHQG